MVWLLTSLLILSAGEFDFFYDYGSFREGDWARLEIYYELPYTQLQFVREPEGFRARYRVYLQCFAQKELVAGDVWNREIWLESFEATKTRTQWTDRVEIRLQPGEYRVELKIEDLTSQRVGSAQLQLNLNPSWLSSLKFLRSGHPHPTRNYQIGDTLELQFELYNSDLAIDTLRLEVSDPQGEVRSIYDAVVSGATAKISYELSLTDWADGCYQIRLIRPDGVEAIDSFKVSAPFWVSDASYLLKVNQLQYIATPEEMARLKSAPVSERDSLWQEFWRARDPTPNTELNEAEDEYFERIAYCEEHFGNPDRGYLSDRARVYMRLGAPDEVESHPFEIDRWPYEIWYYYNRSQRFVFVDQQGFGVYILVSPANF